MPSPSPMRLASRARHSEQGMTLIELMVGITIGLLAIAVAMGALMASRGASGTITDASQLQQQASYAFRVIGQQVRQAASMQLNLGVENTAPSDPITTEGAVAFTPDSKLYSSDPLVPPTILAVSGKDAPSTGEYKVSFAYQNYQESTFPGGAQASLFRDCLGQQPSATIIRSQFVLTGNELQCAGSNNAHQGLIRNVADFQVRYLVQADVNAVEAGAPTMQSLTATDVAGNWQRVFGVEICLVLYGDEAISMPADSVYTGCTDADGDGQFDKENMTTLTGERKNRMHMAFRSVFQLRSQGQPKKPIA